MKKKIFIITGLILILIIFAIIAMILIFNKETPNNQSNKLTEMKTEEVPDNAISKTETKIGYYADVDGDGNPDGIIYADLATSKNGQWKDENGEYAWSEKDGIYSYEAVANTKNYYVSQTDYKGPFGTKDVLTAIDGEGEDRFYVMALEDFSNETYCWYDAGYGNLHKFTTGISTDFGTGMTNTENMIEKWNSNTYGNQNDNKTYLDVWGVIQQKVSDGWFIPSKGEWCAFSDSLDITSSNYTNYGLSKEYWSSSQLYNYDLAWCAGFSYGYTYSVAVNGNSRVRLSTTF